MPRKILLLISLIAVLLLVLTGCDLETTKTKDFDFTTDTGGKKVLNIVSGSENKELEPILKKYAESNDLTINVDYLGSIDMMKILQEDDIKYDAVWPASSIWLSMAGNKYNLKYEENTSFSPVVFGIKKSVAEKLGFVDKSDISIKDISKAIEDKQLKFTMTSATQSNSGSSAYLSFLSSMSKDNEITEKTLMDAKIKEEVRSLLSGVNRSSGSSHFLKDAFLKGDYDAMVNYESMIISANQQLLKENKEPLYMIYPKEGVAVSNSPIAFIDKEDNKDTEKTFLDFQKYLTSENTQDKIEQTGRRSIVGTVSDQNKNIFKKEWGIDLDKTVNQIRYPNSDLIMQALNLYQTELKKPALTLYVMDYSGSMHGKGKAQMMAALDQIFVSENAKKNLLQGNSKDLTYAIAFDDSLMFQEKAYGNGTELESLYHELNELNTRGGTNVYIGLNEAINIINSDAILSKMNDYTVAIVVMSDGETESDINEFSRVYKEKGHDVPIYSIMYGDADPKELETLAELSNAKVFDGRDNLTKAFQQVRGYN